MENTSVAPRLMSLHFLEEITNNFSNDRKIGVGSYGSVYKGEQKNGEAFAVKLLHYIPGLDDLEFKKEYLNLASLQHKNVVRLIGYCHETRREFLPFNGRIELVEVNKRALCFEYLPNGSLDKCLSDELNGHDWHTRYTIIKGICEGLKYLHEDLESPMYHLDLKPGNVLLDENMVAKIADFGLSRMFGGERTQMTKSAIGTIGYVPPEFIDAAIISDKFDIFSLGVIMIKILTGPTGYFRSEEMSSQEFIELVHANWRSRLHAASVHIFDSCSQQVKICIEIALSCLQGDRSKRPSIGLIVNKLNETETLIQSPHKDIGSSTYKVIESRSMRDKKQYTNSGSLAQALTQFEDDSSLHSESAHLEVIDEEKTVAPNSDDSSLLSAGTTNVEVNDEEESTTAPPLSETRSTPFERPRLDLVIVADVSSSIENLRMKELKDAMRSAVGWLSAMDRLSVVVCASPQPLCPLREVTGNGRQELLKLIDDRIKSSPYGNNIGNGLLTGLNVLADRKVSAGRVGVIFLVCDNQQKPGNASQVSAGNVPVYTFGFGADSKHTVLQAVAANSTGGTFSRVPDVVEYGAGLQTAFSRCLTLLLHGFADTEPPLYLPAAYFGDIPVSHCYDDDGEQQEEEQADIPEPKGEALLRLWPWRAGGHRSSDLS